MTFAWIKKVNEKTRIVTHGDTDGIMSAVLIYKIFKNKNLKIVITDHDEINSEKDRFIFTPNDIVLDLPQPDMDVVFWADHHITMKNKNSGYHYLYDEHAKSCAGLLYQYLFKKYKTLKNFSELIVDTDMIDSANYPNAKYQKNLDNYGNKIRLGLDGGSKIHNNMFYKPALIREIAISRDWRKVLDNPLHMARVYTSLYQYKEYEEEVVKYLSLKGKVAYSDVGNKRLPGLLNRYYVFELFPDAFYSLAVYMVKGVYRIVISLNTFNKDSFSKRLDLGAIAKIINPQGGGHKGIGVIPDVKKEEKDRVVADILALLGYKE